MRVELLWWDGCPSHPEALADLQDVLRRGGARPGHPGAPRGHQRRAGRARALSRARPRSGSTATTRCPGPRASRSRSPAGSTGCATGAFARTRLRRPARGDSPSQGGPMTLAIGDEAPAFSLPDTDGAEHSLPEGELTRSWSSPATTAPTRWPGTTASFRPPATIPRCTSWRSTPTTPSATRTTRPRPCASAWSGTAAGRCPTCATSRRRWPAAYGRPDHAARVRGRRRGPAPLRGRARCRPPRSEPGRGLAA